MSGKAISLKGLLLVAGEDNIVKHHCYVTHCDSNYVVLYLHNHECIIDYLVKYGYVLAS